MSAPSWMTTATTKPSSDGKAERIRAKAEQDRLDAAAAIEVERQRLALDRQKHAAKQQERAERQHHRQATRAKRIAAINRALPTIGRRTMITTPIVSPMTVAWIGQILFAVHVLGWPIWAAIIFAASWELTTAFAGWMYHQARQDGDRGTIFRFATWLFAASAGAMNYWHALDGNNITHPTPKAVSYGAMSLVGIGLWELYASLIHRKQLRARGAMPPARPRFGIARWSRFPRHTYKAWSISIRDGLTTTGEAWAAVAAEQKKTINPNPVRVVIVTTPAGGYYMPMTALHRSLVTTPWGGLSRSLATGHNTVTAPATDHQAEPVIDRSAEPGATTRPSPRKTGQSRKPRPVTSRTNAQVNAEAVTAYRESVQAGEPLTQRTLAAKFDRSPGWGRARIQEAGIQRVGDRSAPVNDRSDDRHETTAKEASG